MLVCLIAGVGPARANILVVAPHPDDDLITSGGVIYRAVQRGEPVRVVFMTNGDWSGLAQGQWRQDEAVSALVVYLGMVEDHLIFLGYPDAHLEDIYGSYTASSDVFTNSWGQSTTYGHRGLGRCDYHSYRFGSPANYNRPNIVADLRDIIASFQPDHIFITAEFDTHRDHSTSYYLLRLALGEVFTDRPGYDPTVHKTIVHSPSGPWPNSLDPTACFAEIPNLVETGLAWGNRESLDVPLPLQSTFYPGNSKYQAISAHVSEEGAAGFLGAFVHKDEIFWVEQEAGANKPPVVNAGFDQTVPEGTLVQLDGSASFDLDGGPLTYQWRQVEGPLIQLSNPSAASPAFTAPTGLAQDEVLTFELVVGDGTVTSVPDAVNVIVTSPLQPVYGSNAAPRASVSASSEQQGSEAVKGVDGVVDGYPGDPTREWITQGERGGAWIQLQWPSPVTVGQVILYDRPNGDDYVAGGTLSFSDGSSVVVGGLDNWGRKAAYAFSARTVTNLRFTIDVVGPATRNVGLSEIEVFEIVPGGNQPPDANAGPHQTVDGGAEVQLDGSASFDRDGDPLSYRWVQTAGRIVTLSDPTAVGPTFTAPVGLPSNELLTFRLVVNDGRVDSSPAFVDVTVPASRPPASANIARLAEVTASSETPSTAQFAIKSVDGYIDGYPRDYTREWATAGERAGAWLQLAWAAPRTVDQIILYDRPNANDQILGATIHFSDGSTLTLGPLDNGGAPVGVAFPPKTITSLRLTADHVSSTTVNIGLSEIEVYKVANRPPAANAGPDQNVSENATVQLDGSGSSDPDGDPLWYHWTQTAGTPVVLSDATAEGPTFTAPSGLRGNEQLMFLLLVNDGNVGGAPDSVSITVVAADDDGDSVPNADDCAPYDPAVWSLPDEAHDLRVDKAGSAQVTWMSQGPGARYDVAGGLLRQLQADGGTSEAGCLANDMALASWVDGRLEPPPDDGYYYIVRAQNACGTATYGAGSDGIPRPSQIGCP